MSDAAGLGEEHAAFARGRRRPRRQPAAGLPGLAAGPQRARDPDPGRQPAGVGRRLARRRRPGPDRPTSWPASMGRVGARPVGWAPGRDGHVGRADGARVDVGRARGRSNDVRDDAEPRARRAPALARDRWPRCRCSRRARRGAAPARPSTKPARPPSRRPAAASGRTDRGRRSPSASSGRRRRSSAFQGVVDTYNADSDDSQVRLRAWSSHDALLRPARRGRRSRCPTSSWPPAATSPWLRGQAAHPAGRRPARRARRRLRRRLLPRRARGLQRRQPAAVHALRRSRRWSSTTTPSSSTSTRCRPRGHRRRPDAARARARAGTSTSSPPPRQFASRPRRRTRGRLHRRRRCTGWRRSSTPAAASSSTTTDAPDLAGLLRRRHPVARWSGRCSCCATRTSRSPRTSWQQATPAGVVRARPARHDRGLPLAGARAAPGAGPGLRRDADARPGQLRHGRRHHRPVHVRRAASTPGGRGLPGLRDSSAESVARVARAGYLAPANLEVALSDDFLQPGRLPEHAGGLQHRVRTMRDPAAARLRAAARGRPSRADLQRAARPCRSSTCDGARPSRSTRSPARGAGPARRDSPTPAVAARRASRPRAPVGRARLAGLVRRRGLGVRLEDRRWSAPARSSAICQLRAPYAAQLGGDRVEQRRRARGSPAASTACGAGSRG